MKDRPQTEPSHRETTVALTMASFFVWLALFHDGGCAFTAVMDDLLLGGHPLGIYLNCFASPLGWALGALLALGALWMTPLRRAILSPPKLLVAAAVLHVLFYGLAATIRSYIAISIVSVVIGILVVSNIIWYVLPWLPLTKRFIVITLVTFIVGCESAASLLSLVAENQPVIYGLASLPFLAPFAMLVCRTPLLRGRQTGHSGTCAPDLSANWPSETRETASKRVAGKEANPHEIDCSPTGSSNALTNRRKPESYSRVPGNNATLERLGTATTASRSARWWRLLLHLVCYGVGFGIIHAMIGFDAAPTMRITPDETLVSTQLVGCLIAGALSFLAARYITRVEDLWLIVRGAVFPLLIVGYTLVVITSSAFIPSIIATVGGSIYDMAFFLGCLMMHRETEIDLRLIVSAGFGCKEFGVFAGSVAGFALGDYGAIADQTASAIALLIVFVVLSVGTFWIGSERAMRKWWGLRVETTPEYHHEQTLQAKCAALAAAHHLSKRESEILFLIASGKRPAQIKEECSLSIFTVRNHIQNIYRKLDVHSLDEFATLLDSTQVLV